MEMSHRAKGIKVRTGILLNIKESGETPTRKQPIGNDLFAHSAEYLTNISTFRPKKSPFIYVYMNLLYMCV